MRHIYVNNVQLLLFLVFLVFFFNQPVFQPSSGDMSKLRTIDKIPKRKKTCSLSLPKGNWLLFFFFFQFQKKKKRKIGIVFRRRRRKKRLKSKKRNWIRVGALFEVRNCIVNLNEGSSCTIKSVNLCPTGDRVTTSLLSTLLFLIISLHALWGGEVTTSLLLY